jgi:hypothetical protein
VIIREIKTMTNSELKSKVVTLGNKLAPRMGGDRHDAFIQAWAIVKAPGAYFAGVSATYSMISPGWQFRTLHILFITSRETGSPFAKRASVPEDMPTMLIKSVFLRPRLASNTNNGLYEIPIFVLSIIFIGLNKI